MKQLYIILISSILLSSCGKTTNETTPVRKDVTETVFASGVLEADGTYNLTAQNDGYLIQVLFEEGDVVKEGMLLAVIDNQQNTLNSSSSDALYEIAKRNVSANSPSLLQAKNSLILAKQKMQLDSSMTGKYQLLMASNSVSKSEYDNVRLQYETSKSNYYNAIENYNLTQQQADQSLITSKTQKELNALFSGNNKVVAVFNGKIYKKFKQRGDYVRKGDIIATIGDPDFIYATVSIDEGNIEKVKVGQEAFVKLNINKDKIYKGRVSEISPSFDETNQSFTCKIVLTDVLDFTIVNTQLQANIVVSHTKHALLIPRNYIDFGGYVQLKGHKQKTKLTTKFVSNEWVQVLSGINDKAVLVTDNIRENKTTTSEAGAQMSQN